MGASLLSRLRARSYPVESTVVSSESAGAAPGTARHRPSAAVRRAGRGVGRAAGGDLRYHRRAMLPRSERDPFTVRLRDLLSTLESSALLGAAEARVRGLGEQLRFACLALPCSEALVALEMEALGRLTVPAVADVDGVRPTSLEFQPSGTPFAYLLGGGSGHGAQLAPDDPMIAPLRPALLRTPTYGIFVPIRLGDTTVGGAALFSHDAPLGDRELVMAERLSEVLSLTVESFRTERVVFELFARALPDLLGPESSTSLPVALERHIRSLRLLPTYRRRLELAMAVGRVADHGEAEATLAESLLSRIDAYMHGISGRSGGGGSEGSWQS